MLKQLKQILIRSIGVVMFAFIPGAAVGGTSTVGWIAGGLIGVMTVFSSIIIFFGVQLAWDAHISDEDIEKGFRAAVAKQAADNKEVAEAVKTSATDINDLSDFGDLTDLFDDDDNVK
ncbi:hypothetical protein UFOVP225_130 [uncultured Caudovirales phage]|uniref:Uncharacterized protein n=1 Tax=uncultured Caudovirales phage TaxID=2100421 RepID=A0A6J7WUK2_9CAUD|nr:hypothetical protein UFOVP113_4 [uncultured Caudovirales phage]CAB5219774.1 hypothetical protein UFOVP225_130 [uncultured Caudovirales phage]